MSAICNLSLTLLYIHIKACSLFVFKTSLQFYRCSAKSNKNSNCHSTQFCLYFTSYICHYRMQRSEKVNKREQAKHGEKLIPRKTSNTTLTANTNSAKWNIAGMGGKLLQCRARNWFCFEWSRKWISMRCRVQKKNDQLQHPEGKFYEYELLHYCKRHSAVRRWSLFSLKGQSTGQ